MSLDFLHGVEVVTVDNGIRPIQTVRSAIIGLIGTASDANEVDFPLDTPVLVRSRGGYGTMGDTGTLKAALDDIFTQWGATVVVVRVEEGDDIYASMANIIGGEDEDGNLLGMQAFRGSASALGVSPMILIAPGFTSQRPTGASSAAVTTPGAGYESAPDITFAGGGSDPAKVLPTGHAVLGTGGNAGKVMSIVIDTPGVALSGTVTYSFSGGSPDTPATAGAVTLAATKNPVVSAFQGIAAQMRAHVIAAGPSTTDTDALAYRNDFGDRRVFVVDPFVSVLDSEGALVTRDATAMVAGLIARIDAQVGFWKSPSNEELFGVSALGRPIDWALGDPNTRANNLNANQIATIIREAGFRLWGNRTTSIDPIWAFLCVSRTADMIDISIMQAHRWAVDRVINRNYFEDVKGSVNAYLRSLQARGAILGGSCWVDPDLNQAADITAGHATFSYDFTAPSPAERVTFMSQLTDAYVASIFANS